MVIFHKTPHGHEAEDYYIHPHARHAHGSIDSTIVILAFPTISDSLHADFITTLWVILIYLLVVAVCTTQLGRIGDIYGRSRMFNAGFGILRSGRSSAASPRAYSG